MFNAVKANCHYCGAIDVYICSTPEKDGLCAECHKLVIENSREAIKAIKTTGGKSSKKHTNKNTVLKHKRRFTVNLLREIKHDLREAKKNPFYQKTRRKVSMQKALTVMFLTNPLKGYFAWRASLVRRKVI